MKYWETNSFEIFSDGPDYVIEFRCFQCRELLKYETDDLSGPFEIDCPHCNHTIFCQLKLVMEHHK